MWPFSTIKRLRMKLRNTENKLHDIMRENGLRHQKLWQNEVEIDSLKNQLQEAKDRLRQLGVIR